MQRYSLYMTIISILVLTLISCVSSTTKLTGTWRDDNLQREKYQKILVIGAAKRSHIRKLFEDGFVKQLESQGVNAVASHTILESDMMLTKGIIKEKAAILGADAVLISKVVALKEKKEADVRGSYKIPYATLNQMNEYYQRGLEESAGPAPTTTHKIIGLETNLYDAGTEKLVWTAASDLYTRDTESNLIKSFIKVIVSKLASDQII